MKIYLRSLGLVIFWGLGLAQAQTSSRMFEFSGGYVFRPEHSHHDDSFYSLKLRGNVLAERGVPISFGQHFSLAGGESNANQNSDMSLKFEHGLVSGAGSLFEALSFSKMRLKGFELVRGSALLGSSNDGKQLTAAVGLETPHFRVPGLAGKPIANWAALGVQYQRKEATDDNSDVNEGIFTGRAFAGRAFGKKLSATQLAVFKDSEAFRRQVSAVLGAAANVSTAKQIHDEVKDLPESQKSYAQDVIEEVVEAGPNDDVEYRKLVEETILADSDQRRIEYALYAEASGWYTFRGDPAGERAKGLLTASIDWWVVPGTEDIFLRLRYEAGFERAAAETKKNNFIVCLSGKF